MSVTKLSFLALVLVGLLICGCAGGDSPGAGDGASDPVDTTQVAQPDVAAPDPDVGLPDPDLAPDIGRDTRVIVKPPDGKIHDTAPDLAPDVAVDLGSDGGCTADPDCDDGLACTTDICGINGCANIITGNYCVIDDQCVGGGTVNSANECQICQPGLATDSWSNADETGCDDGDICTHSDQCVASQCAGTAYSCDDGLACTTEACNGSAAPPDGCDVALQAGYCLIDETCVATGDTSAQGTCLACDPDVDPSAWTLQAGFCLIDDQCYAEGDANPKNPCEVCQTSAATDAWTSISPTTPSPHQIVITEFMANPAAVNDTTGEWFEIHNAGSTAVDLDGWVIKDDHLDAHLIPGALLVGAGAYVVLARSGSTNGGVTPSYVYGDFLLANTEDEIVLIDEACRLVDRVAYTGSWVEAGSSLQLTDPALDNADLVNWCYPDAAWSGSTGDKGTPGAATVCATQPPDAGPDVGVDAAPDLGVDAAPDFGPDAIIVPCASSGVVMQEVSVGTPDFVALRNYNSTAVDIVGYRLVMYGISTTNPTTYVVTASDITAPLGPGETVYIFEYSSGDQAADINTGANIPFYNGPPNAALPDAALLYDASGNLLDYAAIGENVGKPDNINFTPVPWPTTFDSDTTSFQRVATNGTCPDFTYFDWYYGPLTR